jgi:HPt (histidine-containing phosphotransfer) domain-containing protein
MSLIDVISLVGSSTGAVLAVVVAEAASGTLTGTFRRRVKEGLPAVDPDSLLRIRVGKITESFASAAESLDQATELMAELRSELEARAVALEALRQKADADAEIARLNEKAAAAVKQLVAEVTAQNLERTERKLRRMGWIQGAAFAVFGASIAILVVVLAHWIPTIR